MISHLNQCLSFSTFALFDKLNMKPNPSPKAAKRGELIPYYLSGKNTKELYNDIQVTNHEASESTARTFEVTGLPCR